MNRQSRAMGVAPNLQRVLTLRVEIGTEQRLGDSQGGLRSNYSIIGGEFSGLDLEGQVLPGGADFYLQRPDGTGELDARYSLRTTQGELINLHNLGLLTLTERGRQLERQSQWPLPEDQYHCTCTPRFQVPKGRLEWLVRTSFIGLVHYPSASEVLIRCYRFY